MALKDLVPTLRGTRNVPIRRQDDEQRWSWFLGQKTGIHKWEAVLG